MCEVPEVVAKLKALYEQSCEIARSGEFDRYGEVRYPKLTVEVQQWRPIDRSEPFGYVDEAGTYSAVISRPDLMEPYLTAQIEALTSNYPCSVEVGYSDVAIPPAYIKGMPPIDETANLPRPTLDEVHDAIVDGHWDAFNGDENPCSTSAPSASTSRLPA